MQAVLDAEALWLAVGSMFAQAADKLSRTLHTRFTAMVARKALSMNDRIQILSKHTLREKLITVFPNAPCVPKVPSLRYLSGAMI